MIKIIKRKLAIRKLRRQLKQREKERPIADAVEKWLKESKN